MKFFFSFFYLFIYLFHRNKKQDGIFKLFIAVENSCFVVNVDDQQFHEHRVLFEVRVELYVFYRDKNGLYHVENQN